MSTAILPSFWAVLSKKCVGEEDIIARGWLEMMTKECFVSEETDTSLAASLNPERILSGMVPRKHSLEGQK